jgi:hypothetical protein
VPRSLPAAAAGRDVGPHALAHLGAVDIALRTASSAWDTAASEIDADPGDEILERAGRWPCWPPGARGSAWSR